MVFLIFLESNNNMPKKSPTLKSISSQLGVSTATISNAFNRPDQLSKILREKILSESKSLGYYGPNPAARALRKGESGIIAVLLADALSYSFTDPVASQFLRGVAEVTEQQGKQLMLLSNSIQMKDQFGFESLPDGFIIYGVQDDNELFKRVLNLNKPKITVDFDLPNIGSINIDNTSAGKKIACHVITGKEKNISVLGLRLVHSDRVCRITERELYQTVESVSRRRLEGYQQAARELNLDIPAHRIWHIPINTPENAEMAAYEALTAEPKPEVLLCMSDVIAIAALKVAAKLNINVPNDLKVTGFDDIPEAEFTTPPLTTICQKSIEKGRLATKLLMDGDISGTHVLESKLIIRSSS